MNTNRLLRLQCEVRGVVQGVGFRPFVYRLAKKLALNGWVKNTSGNVTIQVEGSPDRVQQFVHSLKQEAPPVASIQTLNTKTIPVEKDTDFAILESTPVSGEYQPVSADIAICRDCLSEIFEPHNRRHLYPFTNCTNCGPRFTIIKQMPYDRAMTTMQPFTMCSACQAEYDNPLDRRFHAQPNACSVCGPALNLLQNDGKILQSHNVLEKAAELIKQGFIIAIKGIGGYQLACDATNEEVVLKLRTRKKRPGKPFALMMASIDEIKIHCLVSNDEETLLLCPQAPIVLLAWNHMLSNISSAVAQNYKHLGVMLPPTPLHHILLDYARLPLVMTSGNLSEEPICKDNDEALNRLGNIADYLVSHNREIHSQYDDSVYFMFKGSPRPLRRARGYAPSPVVLPNTSSTQILACGAEENNTFCLVKDNYAFISQHIGDMDNEETFDHFENTIDIYKNLFSISPKVVACDLHPDYMSTHYAEGLAKKDDLLVVPVQHHHAHIVSCMVENGITDKVIGVAFDGTGYGEDGNLWGGEFLVCDYYKSQRKGHLEYIPMPGGAAAIRNPYRMALGYLLTLLGSSIKPEILPAFSCIPAEEITVVKQQLKRQINSPLTSSAGRLFDAVSAMTGLTLKTNYKAQAAIELEMSAPNNVESYEPYPFTIVKINDSIIVNLKDLIQAVAVDASAGVSPQIISARFHRAVAEIILNTCGAIAQETGVRCVALSGGVFQNRLLLELAADCLESKGFKVISHRIVPCNDGGISLGQAVIADSIILKKRLV